MTTEEYNNELALLLKRKEKNQNESEELNAELIYLRQRKDNPTLDELLQQVQPSVTIELTSAFVKRD